MLKCFAAFLLVLGLFSVGFCLVPFSVGTAHAYNFTSNERLTEIKFSKSTNDMRALQKAEELYNAYWAQFGIPPEEGVPGYAQYVPLKTTTSPQNFIVYYRMQSYGTCAQLGCEVTIFENKGKNQWVMILQVLTQKMWVSNRSTKGYQDLFVHTDAPPFDEKTPRPDKAKMVYDAGKYVPADDVEKTQ